MAENIFNIFFESCDDHPFWAVFFSLLIACCFLFRFEFNYSKEQKNKEEGGSGPIIGFFNSNNENFNSNE